MSRFILLLLSGTTFLWLPSLCLAQEQSYDVVYYAGGESVHCDLIGVTENTVRYRLSDLPGGEVYNELRDDIVLIFKRNGNFLLPSESGVVWKDGAHPEYDNIVTDDSRVLAASDVQENEDIIYYQDALESSDASVRTDETVAIIYQDGSHKLMTDVSEVAEALGGALAFALPADDDAVASTESMAAPPSESSVENEVSEVSEEPEEEVSEEDVIDDAATMAETTEDEAVAETTEETIDIEDEVAEVDTEPSSIDESETEAEPTITTEEEALAAAGVATAANELDLSEADYEEYAAKAMNKAEYLSHYLALLCNRDLDAYDKEQAVENALKLFVHDSTLVQVSSVTRDEVTTYRVSEYLDHLSLLDYDKVELLWRNVQYITKFRLATDGNYYGTITVEQVFQGYKEGKPIYEDITQKDIEIVLGNFLKEESGTSEYVWDVLLSDIGVEETRKQ